MSKESLKKRTQISKDNQAYHAVKMLLLSKKLVPGQHIVYRELEELLKMSKTPIIAALGKLEQENLVICTRNRGYSVKQLSEIEVEQIFELKEKLQDICVEYAIKRYQDHDLIVLKGIMEDYLSYKGEFYDLNRFKLDKEFHAQIARMGGNNFLTSVIIQLYELSWVGLNLISLTPLISTFKREHQSIYKFIEARDAVNAKKMLRRHDRTGGKMLIKAAKSFNSLA